ncbi:hypothetical protein H2204_005779 [Knufia peltigerae]|uniref:Zn(2)-C6 fungal-type domain-containing protein n=1 Tax=Knufia peltigerae TaxID=1002370 RepID=A0AA39CYH6_9EURO|nr:hypothetical protein H2204_005779 [Knufia peltigerae]
MPPVRGQADRNDGTGGRNARVRRPISCLPCRTRKLRCDRAVPACGNCVNRGEITSCCYVARKNEVRAKPQESQELSSTATQSRIDHLEQLVLTLLKTQQRTRDSPDSISSNGEVEDSSIYDRIATDSGILKTGEQRVTGRLVKASNASQAAGNHKHSTVVDEAHWTLLLNEIGEVRSHLCAQEKKYEEQATKLAQLLQRSTHAPGPTLLFGSSTNVSRGEVLSHLPSRFACDIMITRFFAHMYPAIYILHGPAFHRQYERFWEDNSMTSIVWVGLLYAVLRIAMLDFVREGDEPLEFKGKCPDLASTFRNRLTDCLILADYMQPHEFLIETLCLHLYAEYVCSRDARSVTWVLTGMITRMAMRMGYDIVTVPGLTPFQSEMRRRVWTFIRQADILISFQAGQPSMIDLESCEETMPRNIYDDAAFDETCKELPPGLPNSEPTEVSFLIAKARLAFGFARALKKISHRVDLIRWEGVLEIDRELRRIYDGIPEHYKLGQLSIRDSLVLTSARFVLSSIHHKSLVSIGNSSNQSAIQGIPSRSEMIKALSVSARIFKQMRDRSMEAYKAADILEMLIGKLEAVDHNVIRNPKDSPGLSQTNHSSLPTSHGFLSSSASVDRQKSPRPLSSTFGSLPSSNPSNNASSRSSQPVPRIPGHIRQSAQMEGPFFERPGLFEQAEPDVFQAWSDAQENHFGSQTPLFPQAFPEFDPNAHWMATENSDIAPQSLTESATSISSTDPLSYPAVLSWTDPVAALWNLNSNS